MGNEEMWPADMAGWLAAGWVGGWLAATHCGCGRGWFAVLCDAVMSEWGNAFDDGGGEVSGEVAVENDPEIERIGSKETWQVCERHWKQLCECDDPATLVLSESAAIDRHLYKTFRSQFGLSLDFIQWQDLHNEFELRKWRAVLTACEGRVKWYNMMYLLRSDASASYEDLKGVEDGLLLVPRIQWLMIEIARNYEKFNDVARIEGQVRSMRCVMSKLEEARKTADTEELLHLLCNLKSTQPTPSRDVLVRTRAGRYLTQRFHEHADKKVASASLDITTQWRHSVTLQKLAAQGGANGEAAAFALSALRSRHGASQKPSPAQVLGSRNQAICDGTDVVTIRARLMCSKSVLAKTRAQIAEEIIGPVDGDSTSGPTDDQIGNVVASTLQKAFCWSFEHNTKADAGGAAKPLPGAFLRWLAVALAPPSTLLLPPLPNTIDRVNRAIEYHRNVWYSGKTADTLPAGALALLKAIESWDRGGVPEPTRAAVTALGCKEAPYEVMTDIAVNKSKDGRQIFVLDGVELLVLPGVSKRQALADTAVRATGDIESEVERELLQRLPGIDDAIGDAATSDMVSKMCGQSAEVDSSSGLEGPVDAFFREVANQALSTAVLDVTAIIGTRQRDAGAVVPTQVTSHLPALAMTSAAVAEFAERGIVAVKAALPLDGPTGAAALSKELEADSSRRVPTLQSMVRQDQVGWIDMADAEIIGPATQNAVLFLRGIAGELNRQLGLDLRVPKQCMCACYDGNGAGYVAHRDNVCEMDSDDHGNAKSECHNSREVTAILYTSTQWRPEHGGCLRYWPHKNDLSQDDPNTTTGGFEEVEPRAGTLVIFRSKTLLHEVRPSYARRIAISLWLLGSAGDS